MVATNNAQLEMNKAQLKLEEDKLLLQRQTAAEELQFRRDNQIAKEDRKDRDGPQCSAFPSLSEKKQYEEWDEKILSILSTSQWSHLYDNQTLDFITDLTAHPTLSNHLYRYLKLCLKGNASALISAKEHLRGNGLGVLSTLRKLTY